MSEKQFDHIENRIREAAENSVPDFDENAWLKMEARLDKEDKKRRFLFWWYLLPLLIIVGAVIYYGINNKPAGEITAQKTIQKNTTTNQKIADENIDDGNAKTADDGNNKSTNQRVDVAETNSVSKDEIKSEKAGINDVLIAGKKSTADLLYPVSKKIKGFKKGNATSTISGDESADFGREISDSTQQYSNLVSGENKNVLDTEQFFVKSAEEKADTLSKVKTDSSNQNTITNKAEKKTGKKIKDIKPSRFYFIASLGADAGSVKLLSFNDSKFTAKYGVGVGYQLNKKISIQTGFYASRKKYIAGPGDYNPKAGSYWSMVQIVKVDAACLVYDIPVTVRYNFLQKGTATYFATAGVSSFIMKKEDYQYYYTRNSTPYQAAWSYTGNKNYFSVFNFSAGIEKKLTSQFSLLAEPSISIPISGVGDGRVKLYGAALQLSVKYQPSKKINKK
ncbi:MAG: outer membrane beta-barrel protein [Ferruginibacter sp.]